jgi:phenylacetate-CoA ligase
MRFKSFGELGSMRGFKLNAKEAWKLWFLSVTENKIKNKDFHYLLSSLLKRPFNWVVWECYQHNFLKRSQYWSDLEIKRYRFKRLLNLLNYAYAKVSYYRNSFLRAGFDPQRDFNSLEDLYKIPVLTREDVINDGEQLISKDFLKYKDSFRVQKYYTSGTTGKPLLLYSDLKRVLIWKVIAKRRLEWIGISPIAKTAQLWSIPLSDIGRNAEINGLLSYNYDENTQEGSWSRSSFNLQKSIACFVPGGNIMHISSMPLGRRSRLEQLGILSKFKPVSVTGNPSLFLELACLANENKIYQFKFKAFISKYEILWPHQRRIIEDTFGCRVYSAYSNKEGTINAFGCEYGNYHEEKDSCIMEIVDEQGNESPCGERGKILGTDLFNYAMPFIRYESGDIGIRHKNRCRCNRSSDFFILEGRAAEKLFFRDKAIYASTLSVILRDIQGIKECQFKQKDNETIEIYIVRRSSQDGTLAKRISEKFKESIDPELKLVINYVCKLDIGQGGKFKLIIL